MQVRFSRAATQHLAAIEAWLETRANSAIAQAFVGEIVADAQSLSEFPERGSPRPDLPRPRLRSISLRRNVTIVYRVDSQAVVIIAIRYAGQDWPRLLREG